MVGVGFGWGGRGGNYVEQKDRSVAMKGAMRDGARGSRSEDQPDFLHRTTVSPPFVAATVPSDSTLPPPNRIRISVTFVSTQSFFGHGFFNAGVRRHVVLRFTRERHDPRIGQEAVVH